MVHRPPARFNTLIESVAGRFRSDRTEQNLTDFADVRPGSQRRPYIQLVVVEEAEMESSIRGQAHSVTGPAIGR